MSDRLRQLARNIAERRNLDPNLFERLIEQESNFDPTARGSSGEVGLGQILPTTNVDSGFDFPPAKDLLDPTDNLIFTANYLSALINKYDGDVEKGIAAYNTGMGNVDKGIIPKSTQKYIATVMGSGKPLPRPSQLGSGEGGITSATQKQINRMIEDLFGESKAPMPRPPSLMTIKRRGRMSPLSKLGIPGVGNIAKYSAPGGVASLYKRGSKKT